MILGICEDLTETFWDIFFSPPVRYADLEYIHSQLNSCKVKKMEALMEAVESSYYPAFVNMQRDVLAGETAASFMRRSLFIYFTSNK